MLVGVLQNYLGVIEKLKTILRQVRKQVLGRVQGKINSYVGNFMDNFYGHCLLNFCLEMSRNGKIFYISDELKEQLFQPTLTPCDVELAFVKKIMLVKIVARVST